MEVKLFEVVHEIPDPPAKKQIDGWNLPQKEQKWRRPELPECWTTEYLIQVAVEKYTTGKNTQYDWWRKNATPEMVAFAEREWERRTNGYWFYNNGVPTYITGIHYFYLAWYQLDFGYPDYRDRDRRFFYMWDYVEKSPTSYGLLYLKHRRDGASFRGGCIELEFATRFGDVMCGMQNKVGKDALELFKTVVVNPFKRLPAFFQPISKGTDDPKEGLFLANPPRRLTFKTNVILERAEDRALNSSVTWKPTTFNAYDGKKMYRYMIDESGKMVEMSLLKAWNVHKPCLKLEKAGMMKTGSRIGKAYLPTTVEDMSGKPGQEFRKLWDDSDPRTKDKNGFTLSGLVRYFVDAADGYASDMEDYFDEYGNSLYEKAADYIEARAAAYEKAGDMQGLQEWRRMNPRTPEQAFQGVTGNNIFDSNKLQNLKAFLEATDWEGKPNYMSYVVKGNLLWADDGERRVVFYPDDTGRFHFNMRALRDIQQNNVVPIGFRDGVRQFKPGNSDKGLIGIDPIMFDLDDLTSNYHSKGAALGLTLYDAKKDGSKPHNPEEGGPNWAQDHDSYAFFVEYMERPAKAADFFEDMVKLVHFTGMPAMIERQQYGLIEHFQDAGYDQFVLNKPIKDLNRPSKQVQQRGNYASDIMHSTAMEKWQLFVYDHCYPQKLPFLRTIGQLLRFNPDIITKLDLYCAGEQCLLGANRWQVKRMVSNTENPSKFVIKTYRA